MFDKLTIDANCLVPASVSPAIGNQIQRAFGLDLRAFFEYQVPEQGFTIQITAGMGQIAVCGSTTIERPSCNIVSLHEWRREVTGFVDVYITPDGLDADSLANMGGGVVSFNITMFVSCEGLGLNNVFVLDTTFADTRILQGNGSLVVMLLSLSCLIELSMGTFSYLITGPSHHIIYNHLQHWKLAG